jgi:hypothetical protein
MGSVKKNLSSFISILCLALNACGGSSESPTDDVQNVTVEKVQPVKSITNREEFPLPNCGGTGDLTQSLGSETTVQKIVSIGATASVVGGKEVEVPGIVKTKLEAQVEVAYQQDYQTASSRVDAIGMTARPGSHVVYVIEWEEQKYVSTVSYAIRGEIYRAPYTYILRVPKIADSYQQVCLTSEPLSTNQLTKAIASDRQLFSDNFDDGNTNKWMEALEPGSRADVQDGEYILNGSGLVYAGSNLWENYSVEAKVRLISLEGDFGIFVRAKDGGTLYICQHWKNEIWLGKYEGATERLDTGYYKPVLGESYDLKMDVQDQTILCYVNGIEVAAAKDTSHTNGKFGFRIVDAKIAIDNVEVYSLP